jgi:hypothetical protein
VLDMSERKRNFMSFQVIRHGVIGTLIVFSCSGRTSTSGDPAREGNRTVQSTTVPIPESEEFRNERLRRTEAEAHAQQAAIDKYHAEGHPTALEQLQMEAKDYRASHGSSKDVSTENGSKCDTRANSQECHP